jgi:hypothetical protein
MKDNHWARLLAYVMGLVNQELGRAVASANPWDTRVCAGQQGNGRR